MTNLPSHPAPASAETPQITVFRDKFVPGVETAIKGNGLDPHAATALSVDDALGGTHTTDAHFAAYAPFYAELEGGQRTPIRLTHEDIGEATINMVVLVGDIDGPRHKPTPEWRKETIAKLKASGLAHYQTKGGYRVLAELSEPFAINASNDTERWTASYLAWCDQLERDHGLALDRACKDWTRFYRAPNVTREGKPARAKTLGMVDGRLPVVALPAAPVGSHGSAAGKRATPTASSGDAHAKALDRAEAIALTMPASLEGHGGDEALLKCATELATVLGNVDEIEAFLDVIFNPRCLPPWPAAKLRREAERAAERHAKLAGVRNALGRNREPANAEPEPEGESDEPLILQKRTDAEFVLLRHPNHGHTQVAVGTLRLCISEFGLPIETSYEVKKGTDENGEAVTAHRKLPASTIIEQNAQLFGRVAYDFSQSRSRFEPEQDRVVVGYPPAQGAASFDADADRWLRALFGEQYDRGCAWIASCAQDRITELSAALVLIGPANIGKTLFADVCATMWNEKPVPATLLIARFNGDLKRCPIVFDDEARLTGSGQWSTKSFREAIQSSGRNIELKGKEVSLLLGALRLIIACNGLSDLRFTDVGGADIVGAVGDRLAVVDAKPRAEECVEALRALRLPDNYRVDMPRLVRHFRWIVENTELPVERFIGATGGAEAVVAGHVAAHPEVFDSLAAWVDSGGKKTGPWSAHNGELCVNPAAPFGDALHPLKRSDVDAALAPLIVRKLRPKIQGEKRPVLRVLNHLLLGVVLDIPEELNGLLESSATGAWS